MRIARWLTRLYPREWRARYGEEFLALLEDRPPTPGDVGDIILGAVDAHCCLGAPSDLTERVLMEMRVLLRAEIATFRAYIVFVLAGLTFYGSLDDSPYLTVLRAPNQLGLIADVTHPMSVAYVAVEAGAAVALLAVVVGGAPLAYAAWRESRRARRYLLLPVVGFALAVVAPLVAARVIHARSGALVLNLAQTGTIGSLLFALWFVGWAVVSAWAVSRAIATSAPRPNLTRFAFWPMVVATLAMALMTTGTLVWGIAAHQEMPQFFDHLAPFAGYATAASWLIQVVVMTVATAAAIFATWRGLGAREEASLDLG